MASRQTSAGHVARNRRYWDRASGEYEQAHARVLGGAGAKAWGLWRIPEAELRLLGPVRGRRILELGCGAARWAHALLADGARVVGLDFSPSRLRQAEDSRPRGGALLPLVRADAERLPFAAGSFDIVFCDWGAMTFCDPDRTVPQVSRVLRPGGWFVFSNSSPLRSIVQARRTDRVDTKLRYPYFGLGRIDYPNEVNFNRTYADWITLFRANRFLIDRLVEPRPTSKHRSSYLNASDERWARSWPLESIWRLRREPA